MARKKAAVGFIVGCVLVFTAGHAAWCQEARRPGGPRRGMFNPDRMREMMLERLKDTLGVEDDSWTVLKPRLDTVLKLSREAGGSAGMRGLFRRRRRPEDTPPPEQPGPETPATEKARLELEKTLDSKDAKPEEIKARLKALREAREKAKDELAKAKESLRELLTQRQEAQLVLFGILD